jgi:hypothetical protein
MSRDCASERVPIALAEGRPEDPRARHERRLMLPPLPVEGSPQTGPERPRAPHQAACELPSALSGGMRA